MAVLRVREAFACDDKNGVYRVYRQGDLLSSDDPIATPQRVAMFLEPVEEAARRTVETAQANPHVEQATAAPNERRNLTRKRVVADGA